MPVGALVEVQLKEEPDELVFGCVDLVNGELGVERDHPLEGQDTFLTFDQLEQVFEGQPRWNPATGKWLAEWALVAEVGAQEHCMGKVLLGLIHLHTLCLCSCCCCCISTTMVA
jgi:hypothetical protein